MGISRIAGGFGISLGMVALTAVSVSAATPAELDGLIRATAQPASGIALARKQINAGELLDALGTLERVIINAPLNNEARLLHAGVMCRLDDRRGALVELDGLRGRQIPDMLWAEADEACSAKRGR